MMAIRNAPIADASHRPSVIAFDVIETLFSLESLRPRLKALGLPPEALETWFAQLLRDAFALDCVGRYLPFQDVAAATLERLLRKASIEPQADQIEGFIAGFTKLDAHDDVAPAMTSLRNAGYRLVTLSNGSTRATEILLERAGLRQFVEHVVSIHDVRRWKPAPAVYRHCAEIAGTTPNDMALVAAHAWDIQGAKRAGLRAGYVVRSEGPYLTIFDPPDIIGSSLDAVVEHLISWPA